MINMMQSSFDTLLLLQDSTPLRIDGNGHGQCRVYEGLGRDNVNTTLHRRINISASTSDFQ